MLKEEGMRGRKESVKKNLHPRTTAVTAHEQSCSNAKISKSQHVFLMLQAAVVKSLQRDMDLHGNHMLEGEKTKGHEYQGAKQKQKCM